MENVTSPEQYELLEMSRISGFIDRARGTGRPTKKTDEVLTNSLLLNISMILISIWKMKKTKKMNNKSEDIK